MKKVLITGVNSYVGNSLEKWLLREQDQYLVEKVSLRDRSWENKDFSKFDVVVHVAGIAHRKETEKNKFLYYKVNRDITYEVAYKSKNEGVPHFIFLSSMSVYGMETGEINLETIPRPKNYYGKSKLEAENLILPLNDETFKIAILRPPMIYGKGCKGNYVRLSKLAVKSPLFPNINNKRSMIYIDNLSEFIKVLIEKSKCGFFFPQNKEYVCTTELVKNIARFHNKRILFTKVFNVIIYLINTTTLKKVFGNLIYEKSMSSYKGIDYTVVNFQKSVYITEEYE